MTALGGRRDERQAPESPRTASRGAGDGGLTGRLLLVYPDPPPVVLVRALEEAACSWRAANDAEEYRRAAAGDGDRCAAAVVFLGDATAARQSALGFCRTLRDDGDASPGVLVAVGRDSLAVLESCRGLFDDFCPWPPARGELEARLGLLLARRSTVGSGPETVEFGGLAMNLDTYQAAIAGRPLDLTYMEYELLRFLAARPGKVFTREDLLSRVWGYDYYGGARTVDVHIRRVRAKLGEEHAGLIQTVRSVGYCFGRSHWST